ncbi:sensor histidine kinase [Streptomyces sp. SID13666]|uniref:sensor histidine kinase n=1 Tax=unclassified Streptomyces TaxID=2593676 RepID=UPI0013C129E7|nr:MULTISPECIES: sensor histidine kinase [unclassified Streptomyces]NEA56128.1 sensor histidine kinase [Streptomyces sp. SID13666]NEA71799.1 sensor histidine kinase [Streptomyces sp. SID13588]
MRTRRYTAPLIPGALPWTRNDGLVAVGAAVVDLLGYLIGSQTEDGSVTVPGVLLVVLSALPLLARRSHPMPAFIAVLAFTAVLNLSSSLPSHFGAVITVGLYSAARVCSGPITAVVSIVTVLLTLLSQSFGRTTSRTDVLANVLAVLIVVITAIVVRRWQQEVAATRRLLADRAVADERRRIARELHDIVAHHITTMQLMAGGARANLAGNPEAARDALLTLESSGRMALGEMRQLLDVLRAGDEPELAPHAPQPGADDIDRIVTESRLAGLPTEFRVCGQERPLPPTVGLTVFRVVQEALTNARKHAGRARASVQLTYLPDRVDVEVLDDGAGALVPVGALETAAASRTGYGLIGMHERVALQGGTLETGGLDGGGFRVAASLPLAADERAELLR